MRLAIRAGLSFASTGCPLLAQVSLPPPPAHGTVAIPRWRGRILGVYDLQSGLPIEGASVVDVLNGNSALTTSTGTVSLFYLPEGGAFVRVAKLGYQMQTFLVPISPQDTTPITVVMERITTLPAVVTTDSAPVYRSPALRGVEERRKEGFGHFIAEAQLRKEDDHALANVLRAHIPGIDIVPSGRGTYLVSTRDGRRCYPDVYLDGVRYGGAADLRNRNIVGVDLSQFEVSQFAVVEFYQVGTVPPQYNSTGAGCGALLLWSRER